MTRERWLVTVETSACCGSGLCVGRAPELFRLGADRHARAVSDTVDAGDDSVVDAAECCPTEAIRVLEEATGRLLYPDDLSNST